jgi:cytochrome c5
MSGFRVLQSVAATLLVVAAGGMYPHDVASADSSDRSGKRVVQEVCAACHEQGANGAPRIGDKEAWKERTSLGLTALTQHALDGIRQMPPHGGQPELSDLEIARAITYMVNLSGGDWVEPTADSALMRERTGQEVVDTVCAGCHQEGKNGAPRIGDTDAWVTRLKQGLPHAVRSAITGHGGMPPRGGVAYLTDADIRNAILYMFNPKAPSRTTGATSSSEAQAAPARANYAVHGGMEAHIGYIPAKQLRKFPPDSAERSMHGGIPSGNDWYHVNVSLLTSDSHKPVNDAQVNVRIVEPGISEQTKTLEPMADWEGSYGGYFRMRSSTPYRVTVSVRTSESTKPWRVQFEHRHE